MANVRVDLRVDGERLSFDFSRSDKQTRGYVNSPLGEHSVGLFSGAVCLYRRFDIPINTGSLRLIDIVAPEGSIVNCRAPAPTTASTLLTCAAIADAIWIALAKAVPGQSQAGWGRRCAPMSAGYNPRTGARSCARITIAKAARAPPKAMMVGTTPVR